MGFLRRRLVTAALTANAIRCPGFRRGDPGLRRGLAHLELAPATTLTAAADTVHGRHRSSPPAAAPAWRWPPSTWPARPSSSTRRGGCETGRGRAGRGSIGADYVEQLDALPTPAELRRHWRHWSTPFRMHRGRHVEKRRLRARARQARPARRLRIAPRRRPSTARRSSSRCTAAAGPSATRTSRASRSYSTSPPRAGSAWRSATGSPPRPVPRQIIDVKRAIAWIREHIEVRRRPRLHRHHRRLGRWAPDRARGVTAGRPVVPARLRDADTSVAVAVPHYGVCDFSRLHGTAQRRADAFLARQVVQRRWEDPRVFEGRYARCFGSPRTRPTSCCTVRTTHWCRWTRRGCSCQRLRGSRARRSSTPSPPGAQHAFDVFPSIRSARRPRDRPLPALALERLAS